MNVIHIDFANRTRARQLLRDAARERGELTPAGWFWLGYGLVIVFVVLSMYEYVVNVRGAM